MGGGPAPSRAQARAAHEISRPMAFVSANLTFVADRLRQSSPELFAAQSDLVGAVGDSLAGGGPGVLTLLVNAIDAIPAGQPLDHELEVSTRAGPAGAAIIEIRGTGSGLPPAVRDRKFDPFFTTKPAGAATGVGLSGSHGIITGRAGTLSDQSELGHVTPFRIALPGVPVAASSSVASQKLHPPTSSRKRALFEEIRRMGPALIRGGAPVLVSASG